MTETDDVEHLFCPLCGKHRVVQRGETISQLRERLAAQANTIDRLRLQCRALKRRNRELRGESLVTNK